MARAHQRLHLKTYGDLKAMTKSRLMRKNGFVFETPRNSPREVCSLGVPPPLSMSLALWKYKVLSTFGKVRETRVARDTLARDTKFRPWKDKSWSFLIAGDSLLKMTHSPCNPVFEWRPKFALPLRQEIVPSINWLWWKTWPFDSAPCSLWRKCRCNKPLLSRLLTHKQLASAEKGKF